MSKTAKPRVSDAGLDAEALAHVFHEIRTPLTPLRLKIQLARKFLKDLAVPPEQRERFGTSSELIWSARSGRVLFLITLSAVGWVLDTTISIGF